MHGGTLFPSIWRGCDMAGELTQPVKAESIVIGSALAADGERCVRVLMVAQDGSRMMADLLPTGAKELAAVAAQAANGPGVGHNTIYPEF